MHTTILAVLEVKGIITRQEGEQLVEHINNRPQSTQLADAVAQVSEFVQPSAPATTQVKAAATRATHKVEQAAEQAKEEVQQVADEAKADVQASGEQKAEEVKKPTEKAAKK